MTDNYSIPLRCTELVKKNPKHPRVKLEESVRRHVYLILTTRFGENRCDPSYGCQLWEHDFEHLRSLNDKKHHIENSIKILLIRHEPRLSEPVVTLNITEPDIKDPLKLTQKLKKRIEVRIKGRLVESNKIFNPKPFVIYFSPVATESANLH
jgi:predicted component of type VI protein secretion system